MNEAENKIVANIEKYGCHVMSVFDPKGQDPDFTYTIGIEKKYSFPELLVLGLRHELASRIANEYNRRIAGGDIFEVGEYYSGFIKSFDVCFKYVAENTKPSICFHATGCIQVPHIEHCKWYIPRLKVCGLGR